MQTYQSKWGHHPYNYETHLRLKQLYKRTFQADRQIANWRRWDAKTKFRGKEEPVYCGALASDAGKYVWKSFPKRYYESVNPIFGKKENLKFGKYRKLNLSDEAEQLRVAYNTSRMGAATPEDVKPPLFTQEQIEALYNHVEAWFATTIEDPLAKQAV